MTDLSLQPLEPCDCRKLTVLRQDGVPTCHRCQKAKREFVQTWVGQEPVAFKMDEIVQEARRKVETEGWLGSIRAERIMEAFHHDQALKHAMTSMRYEDWRRQNPVITKEQLKDG